MISRSPPVKKRTSPVLPAPPAHKVRLDRRATLVIVVPLVSLDRPVHEELTELPVLSDQKVIRALPGPRVGLDHLVLLENVVLLVLPVRRVNVENVVLLVLPVRRVNVENVVLLVSVEMMVLLVLPVRRVNVERIVSSSGTRR